jgi:large subunit ribosomal protein L1
MGQSSKRSKQIQAQVQSGKVYKFLDAVSTLQTVPAAKFCESVDVAVNLGINPQKSDQVVRGAVVLPHGTGKTVRVAVFAQGNNAQLAAQAGADVVGMEDLSDKIKAGDLNFDVVIATPDTMMVVGKLGTILGPKGLMPNPKVGTVTTDVLTAVKNAKGGQVRYRADKGGVVHCVIGKINFTPTQLRDNFDVLLKALQRARPSTAKGGNYLKKVTVTTTMGPGLELDFSEFI